MTEDGEARAYSCFTFNQRGCKTVLSAPLKSYFFKQNLISGLCGLLVCFSIPTKFSNTPLEIAHSEPKVSIYMPFFMTITMLYSFFSKSQASHDFCRGVCGLQLFYTHLWSKVSLYIYSHLRLWFTASISSAVIKENNFTFVV